jgi:hypothetical protein
VRRQPDFSKKAAEAKRESKHTDFKAGFDLASPQAWCEVVKDIVAMANSGGGIIIFGVSDDGRTSGVDVSAVLALDPAVVTDKIAKYTGEQFAEFDISEASRHSSQVAVLSIAPVSVPLVFTSPGTYDTGGGKQKAAFSKGTVYFRHGAKSEPGTTKDLRDTIERELEHIRGSWLGGIRKVVTAPPGHSIQVLPPEVRLDPSPSSTAIRLVEDPAAPAFKAVRTDQLYPYRQKEVVARLKLTVPDAKVTSHDIHCVRKTQDIDTKPIYFYKPQFSSPQYSDAFVEWMVQEFRKDAAFFRRAKEALAAQAKLASTNRGRAKTARKPAS